MGVNPIDLAAYINEVVLMRATPPTKSIIAGTLAQLGLRERVSVVAETASGKRLGFVTEDITALLAVSKTSATLEAGLAAKKLTVGFTGSTTTGKIITIGSTDFMFGAVAATVTAGFIGVTLGNAATSAANLLTSYNAHADIATAASVNATTLSFENTRAPFTITSNMSTISIGAVAAMRDGVASVEIVVPDGMVATATDTLTLTFGPTTRADGRVLGAKTSVTTVT